MKRLRVTCRACQGSGSVPVGRNAERVAERAAMLEALRLCVLNADTAAKWADGSPKDTLKVQAAPHWPGVTMARELLAKLGAEGESHAQG